MRIRHNPYGGFDCLLSLDPEKENLSRVDLSEREYVVCFFLANPHTYDLFVNIEVKENTAFNVETKDRKILVKYQNNDKGLLEAVKFSLHHNNKNQAITICYDILSMLLSYWSLNTLSGYIIRGLLLIDVKHQVRWQQLEFKPTPVPLFIPTLFQIDSDNEAVFSLYREGSNSASVFYKFICYYKILEAWALHHSIFKQNSDYIKINKLSIQRVKRTITQEILNFSCLSFNEPKQYFNKSFKQFYNELNSYRVKTAHFISRQGDILNFDKYETLKDYYPITNLLDIVVKTILEDEIAIMNEIYRFEKSNADYNKIHRN